MLEGIKRWFSRAPVEAPPDAGMDARALQAWAHSQQFTYLDSPSDGFLIEGRLDGTAWRLEWGRSQRPYIQGQELRLRAEMGLPPQLQLVVLNRHLQEVMEKAVFEQYVEGVQTRIDDQTPPEMRWLVMYPPLPATAMGALHPAWVAVSNQPGWLRAWLHGPLGEALAALALAPDLPVLLVVARGRLSLRLAEPRADLRQVKRWVAVFETALREARGVALAHANAPEPFTTSALWDSPSTVPPGTHDSTA